MLLVKTRVDHAARADEDRTGRISRRAGNTRFSVGLLWRRANVGRDVTDRNQQRPYLNVFEVYTSLRRT